MPDNWIMSLAHLRDAGGGQPRGILHPAGMPLFAGVGPVGTPAFDHRLARFDASGILLSIAVYGFNELETRLVEGANVEHPCLERFRT
jgi:hypothetical protein